MLKGILTQCCLGIAVLEKVVGLGCASVHSTGPRYIIYYLTTNYNKPLEPSCMFDMNVSGLVPVD